MATKEGTTKAGLPGWEGAVDNDECNGRLDPMGQSQKMKRN